MGSKSTIILSKHDLIVNAIKDALGKLETHLEKNGQLTTQFQKKLNNYNRKNEEWKIIYKKYVVIVMILYFFLYCSIASVFLGQIILVGEIVNVVTKLVSITGTTLFLIALAISQYVKEIYNQRLSILHSQVLMLCAINNLEIDFLDIEGNNDNEYNEIMKILDK